MTYVYVLIAVVVILAVILGIAYWHSRVTSYKCPNCGEYFALNIFQDLTSPHGRGREPGKKQLICTKCGVSGSATIMPLRLDVAEGQKKQSAGQKE